MRERDAGVEAELRRIGLEARSFPGHTLIDPWRLRTGAGGHYRVFTPFWRALRAQGVPEPARAPVRLPAPHSWLASDSLDDWKLGAAMHRGAAIVARHARIGAAAAEARLDAFLDRALAGYRSGRDLPGVQATSRLSEHLTLGEIGPRRVWWRVCRVPAEGGAGGEQFLRELAWRDFAHHLLFHGPEIATRPWRRDWEGFPWREDNPDAERWRRGMTGEPLVDAGLREMYVTGTMHNRARMIVASYLTKHLLTHWKVGLAWFADCLIDWDPASNALGWQWAAGSGPDAAPFFRLFNPAGQAAKIDPDHAYRRRFVAELVAELSEAPGAEARAYFDAVPRAWGLDPRAPYPAPLVDLAAGRRRALAAYERHRARRGGGGADAAARFPVADSRFFNRLASMMTASCGRADGTADRHRGTGRPGAPPAAGPGPYRARLGRRCRSRQAPPPEAAPRAARRRAERPAAGVMPGAGQPAGAGMFTLIRPLSALVMAVLGWLAAEAYAPLYAPDADLGRFNLWLAATAAVIGYTFLGARVGRGASFAVFHSLQALVLTAIFAAMAFALRMVFVYGYRRLYREPMDAVEGFFDHTLRFLGAGLDASFLLFLGAGGTVAGLVLHLLHQLLERRRLAR